MATVQISTNKKYIKAIGLMLEIGGFFWTRHPRKLVLNPYQVQVLRDAGVLPKPKRKRGQKEVRFPPHSGIVPFGFYCPLVMRFPILSGDARKGGDAENRP